MNNQFWYVSIIIKKNREIDINVNYKIQTGWLK